jgi:hypothetical protein
VQAAGGVPDDVTFGHVSRMPCAADRAGRHRRCGAVQRKN